MRLLASVVLGALASLVSAGPCPAVPGMHIVWQENFPGPAGGGVNRDVWNIALAINTNNEVQTYTDSNSNLQISGGGTVQLIPRRSPTGRWTSARIETKQAFLPPPGGEMMVQAQLRMGGNPNKQGMWPAFWMMGDAVRHGTEWPLCGELDIMEQVNGQMTAYGTVHCQQPQGGPCNEPSGRHGTTPIPDNDWHTWSLKWDRRPGNWADQSISWLRDGQAYYTLFGRDVGSEGTWATLCHMPYYMILNVAIGGFFPGPPNDGTQDGFGSMMEVSYVAVYST